LSSKYYAFETWLASVIKHRVVASISFIFIKKMIVCVVKLQNDLQTLKKIVVKQNESDGDPKGTMAIGFGGKLSSY
jgi:hypothetical protein